MTRYLLAEFERSDLKDGSRLPTNKELATRLRVSIPTVQTVLKGLVREGRIQTRKGSGTYLLAASPRKPGTLRIAIAAPLEVNESRDAWLHAISGGMMRAVLQSRRPITLIGLPPDVYGTDATPKKLLGQRASVDGLILFPYSLPPDWYRQVTAAYDRDRKPVVHLNPPSPTATTNFVSPDYFGASHRLAETWVRSGRRRILFLVTQGFQDSVSTRLRYAGLAAGIGLELGRTVTLQAAELSGQGTEENGFEAMRRVLADPESRPDAVLANDLVALGALRALRETGARVPEEVSVVGASGLNLSGRLCPDLTRTQHPLEKLGRQLIEMICQRIEQKGAPLPGIVFPTPFIGGATTRDEENSALGVGSRADHDFGFARSVSGQANPTPLHTVQERQQEEGETHT